MKIESNNVYFLIIFLFGFMNAFAVSTNAGPPAPAPPPPPPGLPIDGNSIVILIVALLFGIYIIYRNYLKTKNTI